MQKLTNDQADAFLAIVMDDMAKASCELSCTSSFKNVNRQQGIIIADIGNKTVQYKAICKGDSVGVEVSPVPQPGS